MLFLSLQCRSFSVADPDSHFPLHLHHIQEKILEPPGAVYLQESIFISHWHMSIHLQGESVEAGCSSVGSSAWITEHYWCVWGGSSCLVCQQCYCREQKVTSECKWGICVTGFRACEVHCALLSVRMESVLQPPVSSLLLHARLAGGVSVHLWKHLCN